MSLHEKPRYRGVFPVAPTTFTASGELDLASQKRCIDFMIDAGSHGICILANFSEQFVLSDDEREVLTRTILEHVAGRVPVIVTTTHFSSRVCAERSRRAQDMGAAMVMVMPPYHGATICLPEDRMYPDGIRTIVDAYAEGRREDAVAAYQRWLPLINHENRQGGLLAAKALMKEGGIITCEAPRHPLAEMHPATRAGLMEMARRLDPMVLRWAAEFSRTGSARIPTTSNKNLMNIFNNLINGEWVAGASTAPNVNPSDVSDVIGHYAQADASQFEVAAAAARQAFPAWSRSTSQQRFDLLDAVGNEILARKDEIGRLLSREEGKTLPEGIGETLRAAMIFKFFAGEALRCGGEIVPSVRPGVGVEVFRQPVGVIGLITPWNFPIAIPAWKIAPALAFGNCVIFKPAELVPGCAWTLADILHRAGVPKGVFNLVMGPGAEVGHALVHSPLIDAVSFTGSVATGRRIITACASRGAKVQAEMGGKNPLLVLDDADLDVAVNAAVQSAYFSTGQRCTASSRLVVTEGIHDRFVAAVAHKLSELKVDHALKPGTDIGPVVDQRQLTSNLKYIDIARAEGGALAFGGEQLQRETQGFFQRPALITETTPAMRINREEVFGPVASVMRVKDYDEGLAMANDTEFGLASGICTTSLRHATHFKMNAQSGMVMVNLPTAGVDYHVPFGGRKGSSYGSREQGSYAREFYTTVKTAYVSGGA